MEGYADNLVAKIWGDVQQKEKPLSYIEEQELKNKKFEQMKEKELRRQDTLLRKKKKHKIDPMLFTTAND